ncbi:hepatitis A virus cellular receptor 1 isoform X1 [Herpailurus yagouaroundi]|uniref:hepatitis A virus cellular receptor 1 isoform X1 n=2 Tax=Herpailurus yagouaroundi TaxID=1608482 RepID=UPI001AD72AAA|nr:hepatitis A virus cellular receptor 1 isoform X1 [Puma yagouaroundi]
MLLNPAATESLSKANTIMQPWVAIFSPILLLTDAVVSHKQVNGVVGLPATLSCAYSTAKGVTTMCWGRGACPVSQCSDVIIWTNGSHVTFRKHPRYKLKGNLLEGNVSLTIENVAQTDSGIYCCRVEHSGWFNDMKLTLSLEIKPAVVTSVPTSPRAFTSTSSMPAPTQNLKPATSSSPVQTAETQPTAPQETRTPQPTSSPLYSCPKDGNGTVTQSSDGLWHSNQTHVSLAQNSWMTTSKGLYIGICITTVVLLTVLVVVITKKYLCVRNKLEQLNLVSLSDPQTGALQSASEVGVRAEDNIYIIEDNLYVMD